MYMQLAAWMDLFGLNKSLSCRIFCAWHICYLFGDDYSMATAPIVDAHFLEHASTKMPACTCYENDVNFNGSRSANTLSHKWKMQCEYCEYIFISAIVFSHGKKWSSAVNETMKFTDYLSSRSNNLKCRWTSKGYYSIHLILSSTV